MNQLLLLAVTLSSLNHMFAPLSSHWAIRWKSTDALATVEDHGIEKLGPI